MTSGTIKNSRILDNSGSASYEVDLPNGGNAVISDNVIEQAEQCMRNIEKALAEAGSRFADVVRVRYILPRAEDFESCWPVLRRYFADVRPAATMIAAGLIDPRIKIEIEVTARKAG